ncbi:MAG TPA: coproporphyrinogen III oxidase family protein [Gammaproteobacteria bacterium]|nr:coproporphyrinogen III oxidase family protein [Gammaproteobacteria bacterium]
MKQYSGSFNKRSRLLQPPALESLEPGRLKPLDPAGLADHLGRVLQVQNDFFPCFDWVFPPPLLNKAQPPVTAERLFRHPSVEPGRYSLYMHIPFCRTRCSFCYYTVLPGRGIEQSDAYLDYLLREMDLYAPLMAGKLCESVYIGGGTPTSLDEAQLDRLLAAIHERFRLEAGAEISIEAAPGTLSDDKLALLRGAGVNRLSYGIQTLDEKLLAGMNRHYEVAAAEREISMALTRIGNVNVDTMYGFECEPEDALERTLRRFEALGVPSLSIYALDSQRSRKGKSLFGPPRDAYYAQKIDTFARARVLLTELGYAPVLQNVFVKPGLGSYRHQVRRWDNLPLVALGISAQGYAPRMPYQNVSALKPYYALLDEGRVPLATVDPLEADMELVREVSSKLRFMRVELGLIRRKYGVDLDYVFGDLIRALEQLGYLARADDSLYMTGKAAYYNNIIPMLFAPDRFKQQLLSLPEEYLAEYPVPRVMTQAGCTQSAAIEVCPPPA